MSLVLKIENLSKKFILHTQKRGIIPVFEKVTFSLNKGECIGLTGTSGAGKSTFMRMIYANYLCEQGVIRVLHNQKWIDMVNASSWEILDIRKKTIGYVSQFLRVIPRVPVFDVVAEPLQKSDMSAEWVREKVHSILTRLNIPEQLWQLPPQTFSGGEQQRVNIARCFVVNYPIILLDEPTASLDKENIQTVIDLINEAKERGAAIIGIFHEDVLRDNVCTKLFDITKYHVDQDE